MRWSAGVFRFGSDAHTLRLDGASWQLEEGEDRHADVIVDTTPRDWARIVMAGNDQRASVASPLLQGGTRQVREFRTIFGMLS